MKNICIIFFLSLFIFSCSTNRSFNERTIIGTWSFFDTEYPYSYFEKTYFSDGTACGFILNAPNQYENGVLNIFKSRWRIEKGMLISTVVEKNDRYLVVGEEIKDKIVSISNKELVLFGLESNHQYTEYKVLAPRGKALCNLKL